jgi:hypothetical protein
MLVFYCTRQCRVPDIAHESRPEVRQKTIHALIALHVPARQTSSARGKAREKGIKPLEPMSAGFPLSMGKVARMLDKEPDPGVMRVLISLIRHVVLVSHSLASLDNMCSWCPLVLFSGQTRRQAHADSTACIG